MVGIPNATLTGWALPVQGAPWDHTYVASSCGLVWRCWGRLTGGNTLASGSGSSIVADCLSRPNSGAGIRYGVTGVCHQTANRILHPAGRVTVVGCRGYATSTILFRIYGHGVWDGLATCYPTGGSTLSATGVASGSQEVNDTVKADAYNRAISDAHSGANGVAVRRTELSALVQAYLGHSLDDQTFDRLAAVQARLHADQAELAALLDAGGITPEEYLYRLNYALQIWKLRSRDVLGRENFNAIFGDVGESPETLIDRDTFLDSEKSRNEPLPH
jgi:hypothetical protein